MLVSARALTVLVIAHHETYCPRSSGSTARSRSLEEFDNVAIAAVAMQACEKYPFVPVHRNNRRMGLGYCMIAGRPEANIRTGHHKLVG
jgi:hypothetical protein